MVKPSKVYDTWEPGIVPDEDGKIEVVVSVLTMVDYPSRAWRQAAFEQAQDIMREGDIHNVTIRR